MSIFNKKLSKNCSGQDTPSILTQPSHTAKPSDLSGIQGDHYGGCHGQKKLSQSLSTEGCGHRKTSPLREMAAHHRLSDFIEFLSTFYGIEGEESLEILGRFLHHA